MGGFNPIIINTAYIAGYNALQNQIQNDAQNTTHQSNVQNQNAQGAQNAGNMAQGTFAPNNALIDANSPMVNHSQFNPKMLSTVEIEQQANYIKELLGLPKDFSDLINQIQANNPNLQNIKDLAKLLSNGKINLTALTALLSENSKDAVQKLMMTMMSVSKAGADISQLKQLMGMLNSSNTTDNIQAMKNLLMLYLPYLPLSIRHEMNLDFNIDIFDKIQGPNPDETTGETLKILIQTANYGNVMATLELALNNEVDIFIQAVEEFPEKEVLKRFNEENKKTGVSSNLSIEKNNSGDIDNFKQNIQIVSSDYVSPKLVLACHSLIKVIIDVDSKEFIINEEV